MSDFFPAPDRRAVYKHPGILYAVCADRGRNRLYAGSFDYGLYVFDLDREQKEPAARWTGHDNYVTALSWLVQGGEGLTKT